MPKNNFIIALIFLLFVSWICKSQESGWQQGTLTTTNGDTLSGRLNLNLTKDILQLDNAQSLQAFTPRQIDSFRFFDENRNFMRFFTALPFKLPSGYAPPVFFEVLYKSDTLSLLCRQGTVVEMTPVFDPFTGRTNYFNRQRVQIDFYFGWQNGSVKEYDGNLNRLPALFGAYSGQMRKYIKSKKMNAKNTEDLINIVRYYQEIVDAKKNKN